jgi:uncharacterized protein (TIGR04255 family)
MSGFEPIHDAHAIEQVAMAIQLASGLDDPTFSQVLASSDAFRQDFPRVTDIGAGAIQFLFPGQQIAIPVAPPALPIGFPNPSQVSSGRIFAKYRDNGSLESELRFERNSVAYRSSAYTSWRQVWTIAKGYFDAVIPFYAGTSIPLVAISLNYLDKFRWNGNTQDIRVNNLLRVGSDYVAPHVFNLKDLWHSHTGAFQHIDSETKRLLNVNVDCIDDNSSGVAQRTIAIATILTDMFNQPGYVPKTVSEPDFIEFFERHLRLLHDHGKDIFGGIINDDMCNRIGLFPGT